VPPGRATPPSPPVPARLATIANYLPVSFTKAVLLGGLDAPTGGQAQTNPQPVLLRLADHAFLPNRFRSAVKECLVIGAGYGDISAERAYIRTENLSCVRHDGRTFGSQDSRIDLRRRRQGRRARPAGDEAGPDARQRAHRRRRIRIGQAFQASATTTAISPLGAVSTIANGKELEAGLSTGVGRAMDRLAQYYITLAEKTFPVIEVDAGRTVDVVLTQGVAIDVPDDATDPSTNVSTEDVVVRRQRSMTKREAMMRSRPLKIIALMCATLLSAAAVFAQPTDATARTEIAQHAPATLPRPPRSAACKALRAWSVRSCAGVTTSPMSRKTAVTLCSDICSICKPSAI